MKWLAIALAVLAAFVVALIVGPMILGDKGYVLISLGETAVEMTVISFCILVLGALIAWYVLSRLVLWSLSLVTGSHRWFGTLGERKRRRAFYDGLHAMAAGDTELAQKSLAKTTNGDFEGVNYLASAQIAHTNGELSKARYFLEQASDFANAALPATIMQARIDVSEDKHNDALERLNALGEKEQENKQVIRLKAQILAKLGKWQDLQNNLSSWRKSLPKDDYKTWSQRIAKGKFAEIASKQGAVELKNYWENLPRKMRHDDTYQAAYVQQLLDQGMHADAQKLLVDWQKRGPNSLLFPLFSQLNIPDASPSLRLLESWIKQDEENIQLYSTLGQVAFNSGDDVLAEKALLKATKMASRKEDLLLLSAISERKQDTATALQFYKEGQQIAG
ncbi:heme biosynthesis HemY N-terminal domain-containing protein [Alteromonas hispanica]|uniref:Heme biosynthesis protein n=1 Tax=Alteromonas hispanica TaxID=315421 RepID=A0A6L9MWL7_9ALTE|nr:heme biosynthesis HemY N-terminal domain-containing protein [Alteromonas hispanica]NDW22100.1 heme biosynthesis protein [Alteromonas hispanica]